jgi:hypothetical protein
MLDHLIEFLGTTKFRFTAVLCIIIILLLIIKLPKCAKPTKCPKKKKREILHNIALEKSRSLSDKLWIACKDGLVKGCITGLMTGGFMAGISSGAIFGIVNPLVLYANES